MWAGEGHFNFKFWYRSLLVASSEVGLIVRIEETVFVSCQQNAEYRNIKLNNKLFKNVTNLSFQERYTRQTFIHE
jgi:hypothetical protein